MTVRKAFMAALLLATLAGCSRPELPRLYPVPNAAVIDDSGKALSLDSFHGHVVIYDFIFTRCGGTCPVMTRRMQSLIAELPKSDEIRFVSLTVDPTFDRPQVLSAYAAKVRHDPRWSFLTGDETVIRDLSVQGFKLAAGGKTNSVQEPILHSTKFVLVDGDGMIRAYYDSNDAAARAQLVRDAKRLMK